MAVIFDSSVFGLTLKRTTCSTTCDFVDILMGEMDGGDELQRRLKIRETETLSFDGENGGKKCVRVHKLGDIIVNVNSGVWPCGY